MLEAHVERGEAVLYYADAAHPTHNTRCTRAWCEVGQERPLLTVSGRERVNLNAALNAYAPTQVLLDETRLRQCAEHPAPVRAATGGPSRQGPHLRHLRQRPLLQKQGVARPGWPISRFARCFCPRIRPI
ncbi:MAG: hypothetical protein WKG07_22975 [Hymenobacter sp.]